MPCGSISTSTRSPGARMVERRDDRFEHPPVVEPETRRTIGPTRTALSTTPSPSPGRTPHGHRLGPDDAAIRDVREAEEAGDVLVQWMRPELVRRRDLNDSAVAHDRDPVAERERLGLVVSYVDGGQRRARRTAARGRRAADLGVAGRATRAARRGGVGAARARARGRAPPAAARRPRASRPSAARSRRGRRARAARQSRAAISLRRVAAHPQSERDVAEDVAMREEGVILEDEPDSAPVGRTRRRSSRPAGHVLRRAPAARRRRAARSSCPSRSARAR